MVEVILIIGYLWFLKCCIENNKAESRRIRILKTDMADKIKSIPPPKK